MRKTVFLTLLFTMACQDKKNLNMNLDIQGHRGCRGLIAENTIRGFIHAIDIGVHTLEMDVVISKDNEVIVSHEPFFHHEISTHPEGLLITEVNERDFNIFKMTLPEIQKFDVGSKLHPRFPLQDTFKTFKPSLKQVVDSVETYIASQRLLPVRYNVEIKHDKASDGIYNPDAATFTNLVYKELKNLGILHKCTIQSFDPECLNVLYLMDSTVTTAFLVDNHESFMMNLQKLNYKPSIYSPNFHLVDNHVISYCHSQNIKIIPWTVNETDDISSMISAGVDGIISDFPDKVIEIYEGMLLVNKVHK